MEHQKNVYFFRISDYDLKTSLCELVDNAIDQWIGNGKVDDLIIEIVLDSDRQLILVSDNSGGVREEQLRLLVAPGASGLKQAENHIGIFGVGGKRAGIALGERVEIRTRYKSEATYQIAIDSDWLSSDSWEIDAEKVNNISPGCTVVDISKLRQSFNSDDIKNISIHLSETYANFLSDKCRIKVNSEYLEPKIQGKWSYPPGYEPKRAVFNLDEMSERGDVGIEIVVGLIADRDPESENYGVDFYCNDRLIVKNLRTRDVGYYVYGEAGVPHPDASLCRAIVKITGMPNLMPWTSNKSGINFSHPVFLAIRKNLIELVSYYSSLSRRLKDTWQKSVFAYEIGNVDELRHVDLQSNIKLVLPELPRVRKPARIKLLKKNNTNILKKKPWTIGLIESLGVVDIVLSQNLETKNRVALILLDSNFEIALKEYIVSRTDKFRPDKYNDTKIAEIFKSRHKVITEVTAHVKFSKTLLRKVSHYYQLRNKLVHERATVGITDAQIADYQALVEKVLSTLFGLKLKEN